MHRTRHKSPPTSNAALLVPGALANVAILIALIVFSYLREEPSFWLQEGGWPAWLKDVVANTYYPLMLLELLLLAAFSAMSIHMMSSRSTSASLAVVLLPMLWGLFFLAIVNSVANNVENLLSGRPLHWHPGDSLR